MRSSIFRGVRHTTTASTRGAAPAPRTSRAAAAPLTTSVAACAPPRAAATALAGKETATSTDTSAGTASTRATATTAGCATAPQGPTPRRAGARARSRPPTAARCVPRALTPRRGAPPAPPCRTPRSKTKPPPTPGVPTSGGALTPPWRAVRLGRIGMASLRGRSCWAAGASGRGGLGISLRRRALRCGCARTGTRAPTGPVPPSASSSMRWRTCSCRGGPTRNCASSTTAWPPPRSIDTSRLGALSRPPRSRARSGVDSLPR
mmetsp:Transcript_21240/g.51201  ORF Transcript_21240/g.51201 Transcript_21240/m.51201 type:complete len:263 (-) Transcript_21240:427-1215(-)